MLLWLIEKYKYDYSEDQIIKLLHLLKTYHPLFVKPSNPHLKLKIDTPLQHLIAENAVKYPHLKLSDKYAAIFFTDSEVDKSAKRKLIDQVEAGKTKARDNQKAIKVKRLQEQSADEQFKNLPATLK